MIGKKNGNTAIVNLISVLVTAVVIIAVGVIYYIFLSPDELELKKVEYTNLDKTEYAIDKEFERGLNSVIDFYYVDEELDMHEDLKDYYKGREDPFSQSEDRNAILDMQSGLEDEGGEGEEEDEDDIDINEDDSVLEL